MDGKRVAESRVTLSQLMQPEHANILGNVHGGWLMKLMDEAAGLCATRHARHPAVTVAIDSLTFHSPVHVGNLVIIEAQVTYVGRTSIELEVHVHAEDVLSGQRTHTNSAYMVFVALGPDGRPIEAPPLIIETDEERERYKAAQQRQRERLARRKE